MSLRDIILSLLQMAILFAFPTIWGWITNYLPGWPLDPESTLNIIIYLAVVVVSWLLGYLGIKKFINTLKVQGLAADVKS